MFIFFFMLLETRRKYHRTNNETFPSFSNIHSLTITVHISGINFYTCARLVQMPGENFSKTMFDLTKFHEPNIVSHPCPKKEKKKKNNKIE